MSRRSLVTSAATVVAAALLAGSTACSSESPAGPVPVDDRSNAVMLSWNVATHDAINVADGYANPLTAVRTFAIVHLAQHDAVSAITPAFETYAFRTRDASADPVAAAAASAHEVLTTMFPRRRPRWTRSW